MKLVRFLLIMLAMVSLHINVLEAKAITSYRPVVTWDKVAEADLVTLFGPATVSQEQMISFILARNPEPKINCSIEELVAAYYKEGDIEGIRPDVALCQALKETGFFMYGNDVSYQQNNFCGLGATGNKAPGFSFFTPQRGVRAHIQHLIGYASKNLPKQELIDPRYEVLVTKYPQFHGTAVYWTDLNGKWAVPGTTYGQDIIRLWREAQSDRYGDSPLNNDLKEAEANPDDISAWQRVYITARQMGNYKEAVRACNEITRLDKYNVVAFINCGDILREWGKNEEALAAYDAALALRPKKYDALNGKAYLLATNGYRQQALELYDKILASKPDDSIALYNRACLLVAMGNAEQGFAELKKLAEAYPNNEIIQKAWAECQK